MELFLTELNFMTKRRLWRVDFTHQMGYQAPYLMIETTQELKYKAELQALELAEERSRLADFDCWTLSATCTGKKQRNGKWFTDAEINAYRDKLERIKQEAKDSDSSGSVS